MDDTSTRPLTEAPTGALPAPPPSADDVTWRQLRPGLWAGRANDKPIGIIEHGRRYSFTGIDDQIHPGYRTLADAQNAATGPIQVTLPPNRDTQAQSPRSSVSVRLPAAIALIPAIAAAGGVVAGGIALAAQFLLN